MASTKGRILPLSRKASINRDPLSLGRIFGEIPPAKNRPPVDMIFSPRFEV
jgi:hypothetical protein